MDKISKNLNKLYPCRTEVITNLLEFLGQPNEAFPSAIYLYGHSGTGKTAIVREFIHQSKKLLHKQQWQLHALLLNCVEAYTTKILLESILQDLLEIHHPTDSRDSAPRCENLSEFVGHLRRLHDLEDPKNPTLNAAYIIALDNAERLRDMEANVLPSLLRLQELTGLNICMVLMSQIPFEKYYCKTGLCELMTIHFTQYTKNEAVRILSADLDSVKDSLLYNLENSAPDASVEDLGRKRNIIESITTDFYANFLNLFLGVFYKACRDLPELKINSRNLFSVYMEPVLEGSADVSDVSRLWRHITNPLRLALAQVYLRFDQAEKESLFGSASTIEEPTAANTSVRKLAQNLELPYYAKYLLIAAFIASHNSPKEDKRLFVKHHGKQRKRMQSVNAKLRVTEKMSTSMGPKSFTIDRLLAIFYAILEDKVGLTCNLLSQISTLVHLRLLSFVSGESNIMEGSARLQCTVGLEFILYIGKVVGFNVRQYLCDFN